MKNVIFVCHGNICRSPMAEYLFKDMVKGGDYKVTSAATSREEIGAPVHYATRRILERQGIDCNGFSAHQLTKAECDRADFIIGMDEDNVNSIKRICGKENEYKVYKILDFTDFPRDVADPWYTHDFESTYRDVTAGLQGFLARFGGAK